MVDRNKMLESLDKLEVDTYDTEKEARIDVVQCKPSRLHNLIVRASFYRALAGAAEEEFPEDLNIKEHVKSSNVLLTNKALELTTKFEKDCLCLSKDRMGIELKKVLMKYRYV